MINRTKHCDDEGLRLLVSGDEDSDQFLLVAAHVATCDACQDRLETITSADAKATELRALLSSYPLDVNPVERGQHSDPSVAQRSPVVPLDFLGPPSHPEMLGRLGRYEIERVIGSGGMGVVLKGFDTEHNRPVAIKMLAPHLARVGAARQRFAREARSAAADVH
jgi:serine/threonine-protein kinase